MWNILILSVSSILSECLILKSENIFTFMIQSTDLPDYDLWDAQVRKTVDVNLNTGLWPHSYLILKWYVSVCFLLCMCEYIYTKHEKPVSQHMREMLYSAVK